MDSPNNSTKVTHNQQRSSSRKRDTGKKKRNDDKTNNNNGNGTSTSYSSGASSASEQSHSSSSTTLRGGVAEHGETVEESSFVSDLQQTSLRRSSRVSSQHSHQASSTASATSSAANSAGDSNSQLSNSKKRTRRSSVSSGTNATSPPGTKKAKSKEEGIPNHSSDVAVDGNGTAEPKASLKKRKRSVAEPAEAPATAPADAAEEQHEEEDRPKKRRAAVAASVNITHIANSGRRRSSTTGSLSSHLFEQEQEEGGSLRHSDMGKDRGKSSNGSSGTSKAEDLANSSSSSSTARATRSASKSTTSKSKSSQAAASTSSSTPSNSKNRGKDSKSSRGGKKINKDDELLTSLDTEPSNLRRSKRNKGKMADTAEASSSEAAATSTGSASSSRASKRGRSGESGGAKSGKKGKESSQSDGTSATTADDSKKDLEGTTTSKAYPPDPDLMGDDYDYDHDHDDEDEDEDEHPSSADSAARPGGVSDTLAGALASSGFGALFGLGGGGLSLGTGSVSGMSARFKNILTQLKKKGDPTSQLVALQELAEILSMATEDMFIGSGGPRMMGFSTDEFVKALIAILQGPSMTDIGIDLDELAALGVIDDFGFGGGGGGMGMNPELMLLSCRCLSNLIEALPSSTMQIVSNGGVQVLVGKLMEVEYIDLAEQVLSVLEKVSVEYPAAVIRANGLVAVLQYIDFFSLHVQRTAVTIAANAARGLGSVSMGLGTGSGSTEKDKTSQSNDQAFGMAKEVMPILERLLSYADQRLVEQTVRCLGRIIEWYCRSEDNIESLVSTSLLRTVIGLIDYGPAAASSSASSSSSSLTDGAGTGGGSTSVAATNAFVFTQLVKLLANVAKGSAKLGFELVNELGILDVVRNVLTGGEAAKIGGLVTAAGEKQSGVAGHGGEGGEYAMKMEELHSEHLTAAVMNVVVNRPTEQVLELLGLASEILPSLPKEGVWNTKVPPAVEEEKKKVVETKAVKDVSAKPLSSPTKKKDEEARSSANTSSPTKKPSTGMLSGLFSRSRSRSPEKKAGVTGDTGNNVPPPIVTGGDAMDVDSPAKSSAATSSGSAAMDTSGDKASPSVDKGKEVEKQRSKSPEKSKADDAPSISPKKLDSSSSSSSTTISKISTAADKLAKAQSERDQKRFALLKSQPNVLHHYCEHLVPILIEVFGATVNTHVRRRVVECVAKAVWYADADGEKDEDHHNALAKALMKTHTFGKFVSELVGQRSIAFQVVSRVTTTSAAGGSVEKEDASQDAAEPAASSATSDGPDSALSNTSATSTTKKTSGTNEGGPVTAAVSDRERREALVLVTGGILIANVVMSKCGPQFRRWFAREGVLSEIAKIVEDVEAVTAAETANAEALVASSPTRPVGSTFLADLLRGGSGRESSSSDGQPSSSSSAALDSGGANQRLTDLVKDLRRYKEEISSMVTAREKTVSSTSDPSSSSSSAAAATGASASSTSGSNDREDPFMEQLLKKSEKMRDLIETAEELMRKVGREAEEGALQESGNAGSDESVRDSNANEEEGKGNDVGEKGKEVGKEGGSPSKESAQAGSSSSTSSSSLFQGMRSALESLSRSSAAASRLSSDIGGSLHTSHSYSGTSSSYTAAAAAYLTGLNGERFTEKQIREWCAWMCQTIVKDVEAARSSAAGAAVGVEDVLSDLIRLGETLRTKTSTSGSVDKVEAIPTESPAVMVAAPAPASPPSEAAKPHHAKDKKAMEIENGKDLSPQFEKMGIAAQDLKEGAAVAVEGAAGSVGAAAEGRDGSTRSNEEDAVLLDTLKHIAEYFAGVRGGEDDSKAGGIGVTGYEILESGIMDSLIEYLSHASIEDLAAAVKGESGEGGEGAKPMQVDGEEAQDNQEQKKIDYRNAIRSKLRAFVHVFLNGPTTDPMNRNMYVPNAFRRLVQRLQEALSRTEHFEVVTAVPAPVSSGSSGYGGSLSAVDSLFNSSFGMRSFGGMMSGPTAREQANPALQLTRQLKLRLVPQEPDTVPKQFQTGLTVSVHAVATFRQLEDFLKPRLVLPASSTSSSMSSLAAGSKSGETPTAPGFGPRSSSLSEGLDAKDKGKETVAGTSSSAGEMATQQEEKSASSKDGAPADKADSASMKVDSPTTTKETKVDEDGDVSMQESDAAGKELGEANSAGEGDGRAVTTSAEAVHDDDEHDDEHDDDEDEDEDGHMEGDYGEVDEDEDDDGMDDELMNVSDILLNAEEEQRRRRRGSSSNDDEQEEFPAHSEVNGSASRTSAFPEEADLDRGSRRDSVVDVRTEPSPTQSVPPESSSATSAPAASSETSEEDVAKDSAQKDDMSGVESTKPAASGSSSSSATESPKKEAAPTSSTSTKPSASSSSIPQGSSSSSSAWSGASGRSYAAATAASTNRFALQFCIGDTPITNDMTIFAAVFKNELQRRRGGGSPNVWGTTFTVTYKKVPVSDKKREPSSAVSEDALTSGAGTGGSVLPYRVRLPFRVDVPEGAQMTSTSWKILYLLRLLHGLNMRWQDLYIFESEWKADTRGGKLHATTAASSTPTSIVVGGIAPAAGPEGENITDEQAGLTNLAGMSVVTLPTSAFSNNKITAKLNRQLDEPLIVASHVLPSWCSAIARDFSFLVPFESRMVYLQSTSFGYTRSMGRWQQQQNNQSRAGSAGSGSGSGRAGDTSPTLGRIQRQKVRISRSRIMDSMMKVMDLYGSTQALLEVEFFDEVGTGLGPTLEFYASVCKEVQNRQGVVISVGSRVKAWRDDGVDGKTVKVVESNGEAEPMKVDSKEGEQKHGEKGKEVAPSVVGKEGEKKEGKDGDTIELVHSPLGLFPAPATAQYLATEDGRKMLGLFKSLGTFVAKALLDSRIVDLPFSPLFLEMVVGTDMDSTNEESGGSLHLIKHVDPSLHHSLLELRKYVVLKRTIESDPTLDDSTKKQRIADITVRGARLEDLCLDFTLPGYANIELVPKGADVVVTIDNVEEYVDRVVDMIVGAGVKRQVSSFRKGFDRVFPVSDLRSFTTVELGVLMGGTQTEDWSYETIMDSIKADHGYNLESRIIRELVEMMSTFDRSQRRLFLQFVTGSPRLPHGGFRSLQPPLTVVCKTADNGKADDYLPSVMTCVNYLKVPEYSNADTMKERFEVAMREGQGCFHLS
ncbi:Ubiquitin fusion degradation protein 4 [Quaeritorhiza haematococci]|nr:Ubiquitin fusion degradation protein 4 [Quaeritorhiza haematococci]